MTRVLVVEDQRTLADALSLAIDTEPDLECLAAVATVEQAMRFLTSESPDIVLMDVNLPEVNGIEGTKRIKEAAPEVRVLVLTGDTTTELLARAAEAGAAGFLTKDSSFPDILAAIRNPVGGKFLVEGTALAALLEEIHPRRHARTGDYTRRVKLTHREREVIELMGQGLDPRTIAERLVLSEHTARGHVKNVMLKLGAHSQLEAVVVATRIGLLPDAGTSS
jgi:DNA-binding NarL/FixJ family response regulator